MDIKSEIKVVGRVYGKVTDKDGNVKFDGFLGENLVTNAGKAAIAGLVGNTGAITAFSYVALGTSATAAAVTDTTLTAEISTNGLSRVSATVSRVTTSVTNDTVQFVGNWTATGTSTIQEAGVLNAASTGILLAHKPPLTSSITVNNTDTLQITYQVQFT